MDASIGDTTQAEVHSDASDFLFLVTLSTPPAEEVVVDYATADATATDTDDYMPVSSQLIFSPGHQLAVIPTAVNGDSDAEPDAFFAVNLLRTGGAVIGDGHVVGTIVDDNTGPEITINSLSAPEDSPQISFTDTLSEPAALPVTNTYRTADETALASQDYFAESGQITFAPGERFATIDVALLDNDGAEADETDYVSLVSADYGVIVEGEGVGTILDDEAAPSISGVNQQRFAV